MSQLQALKMKKLCRETIMIIYYLEINWILHKAKMRASRRKCLRWTSKASGNHHNPHRGQLSCENEEASHKRDNKQKKAKSHAEKKPTQTKNPQPTKPATLFRFIMAFNINVIYCIKWIISFNWILSTWSYVCLFNLLRDVCIQTTSNPSHCFWKNVAYCLPCQIF